MWDRKRRLHCQVWNAPWRLVVSHVSEPQLRRQGRLQEVCTSKGEYPAEHGQHEGRRLVVSLLQQSQLQGQGCMQSLPGTQTMIGCRHACHSIPISVREHWRCVPQHCILMVIIEKATDCIGLQKK